MIWRSLAFVLVVGTLVAQGGREPEIGALDDRRFAELFERLAPDAEAKWRSIAWRVDLLAAQREAAARKKPLFVWAMDGHPLGCT